MKILVTTCSLINPKKQCKLPKIWWPRKKATTTKMQALLRKRMQLTWNPTPRVSLTVKEPSHASPTKWSQSIWIDWVTNEVTSSQRVSPTFKIHPSLLLKFSLEYSNQQGKEIQKILGHRVSLLRVMVQAEPVRWSLKRSQRLNNLLIQRT